MISKSVYLQQVISRHPFAYLSRVFAVSPLHSVGFLFGFILLLVLIIQAISSSRHSSLRHFFQSSKTTVQIGLLILWPLTFLIGLTGIGLLGGGYQTRFTLPVLPATALLTAIAIHYSGRKILPLACLLLSFSSFHVLYYSVLYSPLAADFDVSIFEILESILSSTLEPDTLTKESILQTYLYMKHFGFTFKL
jgi:hypothetical protein